MHMHFETIEAHAALHVCAACMVLSVMQKPVVDAIDLQHCSSPVLSPTTQPAAKEPVGPSG
jgi:hypothetical protein